MTLGEVIQSVIRMPVPPHEKAVLLALLTEVNDQCQVAMSDRAIAGKVGINRRTVPRIVDALVTKGYLTRLTNGGFDLGPTRARACSLFSPKTPGDLVPYTLANIQQGGTSHRGVTRPGGIGQRSTLGVETCEQCGGTGWMEVDPLKNGHHAGNFTVDKCDCRGGPEPGFGPAPPTMRQSLIRSAVQRRANEIGLAKIRDVLEKSDGNKPEVPMQQS